MSSSIFFRFKSQKEPSQISFDGNSLSVFEVKREIMSIARLGEGKDFDLDIYTSDTHEEIYDDDTTQIPRSTTVLARRTPASRPGAGRAARYVTGQMPLHARNQHRIEANVKGKASSTNGGVGDGKAMTEEEKLQAVLNASNNQMQADLAMSSGKPVIRSNHNKSAAVPDKPLPPGYMCHRCGKTGHWIQACPTNNDPNFDGKHKFKRTTGIPKSFHVAVDTSDAIGEDGVVDPTKLGKGVMYTQDGQWVKAKTDENAWQKFKNQVDANAQKLQKAAESDQELRDRGLECPLDSQPFSQPVKTPCCGKTFCHDCIETVLLDNDLKCPNCGEQALIDDLEPDVEIAKQLSDYQEEKKSAKQHADKEASKSPAAGTPKPEEAKSPAAIVPEVKVNGAESPATTSPSSKKRKAEDDLENKRRPSNPPAMNQTTSKQGTPATQSNSSTPQPAAQPPKAPKSMTEFANQMNSMAASMAGAPNGMNAMMNPMMMNPMMMGMPMNMPMMNGMMPNFNMGYSNMNMPMMNGGGMGMNGGWNNGQQQWGNGNNGGNMRNGIPTGPAAQNGGGDGGAYFRQPVNPHRHQGRGRRQRSVDYKQM